MRLIPRQTKVQTQFFKSFSIMDGVIGILSLGVIALILATNLSFKLILAAVVAVLVIVLYINVAPNTRIYQTIGDIVKFIFGVRTFRKGKVSKSHAMSNITPYVDIIEDPDTKKGIIDYKDYFGCVIELKPVEFYMLTLYRQNAYISAIDNALKTMPYDQNAAIIKLQRPMVLDKYIQNEYDKADELADAHDNKLLSNKELNSRLEVFESRVAGLENCNVDTDNRLLKTHYYFVLFGKNKTGLLGSANLIMNTIQSGTTGAMDCHLLDMRETAAFLKNTYTSNMDERECYDMKQEELMDWILPDSVRFSASKQYIDKEVMATYTIADYPIQVPNAWGNTFFNIDGTRVIVKFKPVQQADAEKRIDRSIMEMEVQAQKRGKASSMIEKNTHLDTLQELMNQIKMGNEQLFDTNIYVTCRDDQRKNTRTFLRRSGFKYAELFGSQREGYISANISQKNSFKKFERGINSSSLAAIFPFISDAIQDENGIFLGYNTEPFFLDFFKRGGDRVNSNMIIIGKSGSGKSFATKGILAHLAADNTKIYVFDPEKEYDILASNLGGKVIDAGSARVGRINPLQVTASLEEEDSSNGQNTSLAQHLQFLEEFFNMVVEGITQDAIEILNECIKNLYEKFNITSSTNIGDLKPQDFPIMQDLFNYVSNAYVKSKDEYEKNNLKIIKTYLNKFAEGGRNSMLWNGYSTITSEENFIVFNFQSLLANNNPAITNAQMLLIIHWLHNEIIKNKDFNDKYKLHRKVIVVIDEAHVFIDPKKDAALDFMYTLSKRIRKYGGMQIIITQNLKDFVGTPEIARKSTAIINAAQYSVIFGLAPHDINDLVALYEKAGQINEDEQEKIVSNPRGYAFIITSPQSRTNVSIAISKTVQDMFENIKDSNSAGKPIPVPKGENVNTSEDIIEKANSDASDKIKEEKRAKARAEKNVDSAIGDETTGK
ncbi:MAG: DUF87 domain-containing protein [Clostridia bacterium]